MTEIKSKLDSGRNTFQIEVTVTSLLEKTQQQADVYLKTLIAQALKNMLILKSLEMQAIVDEIIFSSDTKQYIQDEIRKQLYETIKENVKDMFKKEE